MMNEMESISDHEAEKASNSYLMSMVALIVGMPLPVINLIATGIFFLENRKARHFVRWHCTQALLSQLSLLVVNAVGVVWTLRVVEGPDTVTNNYVGYILTLLLFNLVEFIATIYTAIKTRKGEHVEWFFFGSLTNAIHGERI